MTELIMIIPSRGRPDSVARMVRAWHATGGFVGAGMVWAIDADDPTYAEYTRAFAMHPEATWVAMNEWMPMVQKLDYVASEAAQDVHLVGFMGDDHLPRTECWVSKIVETSITNPGHAIIYGRDGFQDEHLPTWWVMTSSVIRTIGKMVPADVQHLYCDNAVKTLGEAAGILHYRSDVLIEHMHPVAGKGEMDDGYVRVNRQEQYDRDSQQYLAWASTGLAQDATLLRSTGG